MAFIADTLLFAGVQVLVVSGGTKEIYSISACAAACQNLIDITLLGCL